MGTRDLPDLIAHSPFTPHSKEAAAITSLFTDSLLICGGVFTLVTVLVFYCAYKFRAKGGAEPRQIEGHTRLEIGWTLAPVLILAWLLSLTVRAMADSDPPTPEQPFVTIIGHQWWWEARYPSGAVTANEIHIPTGKPLAFRIESADVIHDFWVPELGRKIDAIPGRPVSIWLAADTPGTYMGTCAEYCGVQHAWMRIVVVAEEPAAFARWEAHQLSPAVRATGAAASRGEGLFETRSCAACHAVGGAAAQPAATAKFAPDLTHVAARTTLGAGVIENSPNELARWLKDPQAIKTGCHMPDTELSEAEVSDLVAYFETLR